MITNKLSHKAFKYGHFIDVGTSLLLGFATYKSAALFHHDFSGFAVVTPYVVITISGAMTALASLMTAVGMTGKGGMSGELVRSSMEMSDKEAEKIYKNLNPNTVLSEEEVQEKILFCNFIKILSQAAIVDLQSKFKGEHFIHDNFYQDVEKSTLIEKFYIEHSINKNTTVLSNLFLESLTYEYERNEQSRAFDCFKTLIKIHPELTEADQTALTFHFKKNKIEKKRDNIINFMSQKENFALLNKENQTLFLQIFAVDNRNELIEGMKEKGFLTHQKEHIKVEDSSTKPLVIKDKPIVINHLSYENLNQFRINCESIFKSSKQLETLLEKIEKVLLFKEKLLSFMEGTNDVNTQLFLTQDIDKTINNFNREINILHKMKVMDHPELEENKMKIMDTMTSRIDIILEKMSEKITMIHQSLTEDLNVQTEVNQKVLSSKM